MLTALLLSDIHGRVSMLKKIVKKGEYDIAFVAGDISNYSGGAYREVLETLSGGVPLTVAVPGNVDPPEVVDLGIDNVLVIHKQLVEVKNLYVAGAGGGIGFPFWGIPYLAELHMASFMRDLEKAVEHGPRVLHVLITHTPPSMTNLDRVYSGEHVGSKNIREFVETRKPLLHVCGHIHESRGMTKIGETVAVNPGPAMVGYYGIAKFGDDMREVAVELLKV
ncbi:MAG: metallophosphoesterase family protein [Sulfolobales archaeon]